MCNGDACIWATKWSYPNCQQETSLLSLPSRPKYAIFDYCWHVYSVITLLETPGAKNLIGCFCYVPISGVIWGHYYFMTNAHLLKGAFISNWASNRENTVSVICLVMPWWLDIDLLYHVSPCWLYHSLLMSSKSSVDVYKSCVLWIHVDFIPVSHFLLIYLNVLCF